MSLRVEDEKEMILYGSFLLIVSMFIGFQAGPWVFFIGLSLLSCGIGKHVASYRFSKSRGSDGTYKQD